MSGLKVARRGQVCLIENDIRCPWDSCTTGNDDLSCFNSHIQSRSLKFLRYSNAPNDFSRLWPTRTIPYIIEYEYPKGLIKILQKAIDTIQRSTCVRFKKLDSPLTSGDYVIVTRMKGCWSDIGRRGGAQILSLDIDCFNERTVYHELLHTLGFWHEHNRADRDNYIKVMRENIEPSQITNFKKKPAYISESVHEFAYDYFSVLHYKSTQYSRDGKRPTMIPVNPLIRIDQLGSSRTLTSLDIKKIDILYRCSSADCAPPLITNNVVMHGNNYHVGAVLEFTCNSANHHLVGSSSRMCQANGLWSGNRARCVSKLLHYCNFEDGNCDWYYPAENSFTQNESPWFVSNGLTYHREGTGPLVDLTKGTIRGNFLHLDSRNLDPSIKAIIRSPLINVPERDIRLCVNFGYYLWGTEVGHLIVSVIGNNAKNQAVQMFKRGGNLGPRWNRGSFVFQPTYDQFQIQFEGTILSESGDIAIDDVVIEICPPSELAASPRQRNHS